MKICLLPPDHFNYTFESSLKNQIDRFEALQLSLRNASYKHVVVNYRSDFQRRVYPSRTGREHIQSIELLAKTKAIEVVVGPPCSVLYLAQDLNLPYVVYFYGNYGNIVDDETLVWIKSNYHWADGIDRLLKILSEISSGTVIRKKMRKGFDNKLSLSEFLNKVSENI